MRGAVVDPVARTARVRGGSVWHDVVDATALHGLTALHGSAGDVGVVGYTLSGGVSLYGRRHGLAVNSVRSVRLVTAAGELVTASADENPELFWALRGGSGAFGVVVSLEIDLLPYAHVFAGMMLWDGARAAEVGRAWAEWTRRAPASATTSLRVMHFPPLPELPPFVSGRSVVVVDGAILEADAGAETLLAPLRELEPEMDTFARMPTSRVVEVHMDPPEPSPAVSDHAMLRSLDAAAVDAFVAAAFEARPMISEIRHMGEGFARASDAPGAVSSVDGEYLLTAISMVPVPEALPGMDAAVRAVVAAMAEWHDSGIALTFVDRERDSAPGFGASAARLAELKRLHDPDDLFAAAHRVG
jgi:FAD/FMN-containing dehydrogenase